MARGVYLVGSVPLADATEVFTAVAGKAGQGLRWLPDGETGSRRNWLPWLEPIFKEHPQLEPTWKTYVRIYENLPNVQYRVKPGVDIKSVRFDNLPFPRIASESFREFTRLKEAGVIPPAVKMQITLAGINSVIRRFVVEEQQEALAALYEHGLCAEIRRIADTLPRDQIAIQWDVASAVFQYIEAGTPTRYGKTPEEMVDTFSTWHARLGDAVPEGVDLLFHLCYGDANHRHSIEPASTRWLVAFANQLTTKVKRSIQAIHMPVPRARNDDAYFAPLKDLRLKPGTELVLGLVHYTDGVDGTRARMASADRYARDYMIGTECGFGRRAPETISKLLDIHAQAAGLHGRSDA
jgi:hypothetical protein